jgi:3-phenylpropionate/cinnamic acid dioxygenase small subunit
MASVETQINNLLGRYAEAIDSGNFEGAAALFQHARIKVSDGSGGEAATLDAEGVLTLWREFIIVYADGTPRTKHVITNPIIEADLDAGTATCRSYYTVFQQAEGFPLQAIVCGRYHDEFSLIDEAWQFTYRDYTLVDLVGDMSHHGRTAIPV